MVIPVDDTVVLAARVSATKMALRAADAIHLVAAQRVAGGGQMEVVFATWDRRFWEAPSVEASRWSQRPFINLRRRRFRSAGPGVAAHERYRAFL